MRFLIVLLLACVVAAPVRAEVPDSSARAAILIDMATGTVLYEKNADQRMSTASMSKIMTAYMVFDALKTGHLTLEQKVPISERAWRMQGSKTFVELGNEVKVDDLIHGMVVQSGNDASVALAEAVGGTEEGMMALANERAKSLGMSNSNFVNSTGWPDPNHYSTARDLATLATHLINDFPEYYHYYSDKEFTYHGIRQANRNPLLYMNIGADGIKTGHTSENGYGLIGSAIQKGRRLLLVVNGLPDEKARADEAARLMQWGFAATSVYPLFKQGNEVDSVKVWLGQAATVPVVINTDVTFAMTNEARQQLKVEAVLQEPVPAPVQAGQQVGVLRISAPGMEAKDYPLLAKANVEKIGFVAEMWAKIGYFILGRGVE